MRTFINGLVLGAIIGFAYKSITTDKDEEEGMLEDGKKRVQARAKNMAQRVGYGVSDMWKK